jgi:hypothetical protein
MLLIHGTRSKKVHTQVVALLRVIGKGVRLTATTNAELEKLYSYASIPTLPKTVYTNAEIASCVNFLDVLLQVCTRFAVCFGTASDRKALSSTYDLLRFVDCDGVTPVDVQLKYQSTQEALVAYRACLGDNLYVNETPMVRKDQAHAAVMLDVVCALHKHGRFSGVVTLGELRLDCDLVALPPRVVVPSVWEIVQQCKGLGQYLTRGSSLDIDSDSEVASAVVSAVWNHTLKCLQQIPSVTHSDLVAAFQRLHAYAHSVNTQQ